MEIWKNIPGHPERFLVSNLGRVMVSAYTYDCRSRGGALHSRSREARILKQCINHARGGYAQVTLTHTVGGVRTVVSGKVHRMVALAFIPNPDGLPEVNHKDSNKLNNTVDNLEWVTRSENGKHSYRSGLRKPHAKTTPIIGTNGVETVVFESMLAAHRSGRFQLAAIQRCIAGKAKQHRGFTWRKQ